MIKDFEQTEPSRVRLRAVVFDVDGTMADTERHGHRVAFNRAFAALGLPDRWDEDLYGDLLRITGGERRLRVYLESRGTPPGRARAQARELHRVKTVFFRRMVSRGAIAPRPGLRRLLDELHEAGVATAVATTGTRAWVEELVPRLVEPHRWARFRAVVTGEDVRRRKPDPEAYRVALDRLGVRPADAVAIEDSVAGVRAARGAGVTCLAVLGEYGRPEDLLEADLVMAELERADGPARVLADPWGVGVGDRVDLGVLEALIALAAPVTCRSDQRRRRAAGRPPAPPRPPSARRGP
jgi:HAD superfamily hydrolase (TIGR01509 family)